MRRVPTKETYEAFQQAYDYFNVELFGSALPPCMITLQRKTKAYGYFHAGQFSERKADGRADEIAMNPSHFDRTDEDILSTLVHEQVHLWQAHFGKPSRSAYHNREWAAKMIEIGLMPSDTGEVGGKRTGQRVSHYVIAGGPFATKLQALLTPDYSIPWRGAGAGAGKTTKRPNSKVKFTCPMCGQNAWGKPTASLVCGACSESMETAA